MRAPGKDDPLGPDSCKRHMAVFDGRIRYDLDFAYKRIDKVKADKGYQGPALVCAVYFSPVAGHVPDRAAVKYMTELKDMEVWLVPVAGTRVLVPFRFSVPTPMGLGVLEATQFSLDAAAVQGEREDAVTRASASYPRNPRYPAPSRVLTLPRFGLHPRINVSRRRNGARENDRNQPDLVVSARMALHLAVNKGQQAASQRFGRDLFQTRSTT